jgi:hypothetical protein
MDSEILTKIDDVIKASRDMDDHKRFALRRHSTLVKLRNNLLDYRENMLEKMLVMKQMDAALNQEINIIERKNGGAFHDYKPKMVPKIR